MPRLTPLVLWLLALALADPRPVSAREDLSWVHDAIEKEDPKATRPVPRPAPETWAERLGLVYRQGAVQCYEAQSRIHQTLGHPPSEDWERDRTKSVSRLSRPALEALRKRPGSRHVPSRLDDPGMGPDTTDNFVIIGTCETSCLIHGSRLRRETPWCVLHQARAGSLTPLALASDPPGCGHVALIRFLRLITLLMLAALGASLYHRRSGRLLDCTTLRLGLSVVWPSLTMLSGDPSGSHRHDGAPWELWAFLAGPLLWGGLFRLVIPWAFSRPTSFAPTNGQVPSDRLTGLVSALEASSGRFGTSLTVGLGLLAVGLLGGGGLRFAWIGVIVAAIHAQAHTLTRLGSGAGGWFGRDAIIPAIALVTLVSGGQRVFRHLWDETLPFLPLSRYGYGDCGEEILSAVLLVTSFLALVHLVSALLAKTKDGGSRWATAVIGHLGLPVGMVLAVLIAVRALDWRVYPMQCAVLAGVLLVVCWLVGRGRPRDGDWPWRLEAGPDLVGYLFLPLLGVWLAGDVCAWMVATGLGLALAAQAGLRCNRTIVRAATAVLDGRSGRAAARPAPTSAVSRAIAADPPPDGMCPACTTRSDPSLTWVSCPSCGTRHHARCFAYVEGCSVFGCASLAPVLSQDAQMSHLPLATSDP